jgi:hypothetical protein
MQLRTHISAVLVLAIVTTSCGSGVLLDSFDPLQYRRTAKELRDTELDAPLIVQGSVIEALEEGRPLPSRKDPFTLTQRMRIRLRVEQVIRGSAPNEVDFYYFTYSRWNLRGRGPGTYKPRQGERRIYFLRDQNGILRSIGDVTDFTLPVWTGVRASGYCDGKAVGCCIADLLLRPSGEDFSPEAFSSNLLISFDDADEFCSREFAVDLLGQLTAYPNSTISKSAQSLLDGLAKSGRRR